MSLRVALAEDSAILRDGLVQLLVDRGFVITEAVGDAQALRRSIEADCPDVAVVDIRMPPTFTDEGLRMAIELRRQHPGLAILMFSQYIETRYAEELLGDDAAGIGYLLKDRVADVSQFVDALTRVASGGTALDPEVVTQLMGASRHRDSISRLTTREKDVLSLMAEGRTNTAIAETLFVSEGAVEKHVTNIFSKLDLPVSQADHRRVLAVLRFLDT
jgi:DNA-binding NarL/FixJ family response regulator